MFAPFAHRKHRNILGQRPRSFLLGDDVGTHQVMAVVGIAVKLSTVDIIYYGLSEFFSFTLIFQSPLVLMIFRRGLSALEIFHKLLPLSGLRNINMCSSAGSIRLLGQEEAIRIDEELFNEYKFSVDQLMELAGLSVASVIHRVYNSTKFNTKVLIITGPGNNGGDGIVAARHLKLFGFSDVVILNARKPTKELFTNLLHQADQNEVTISYEAESFQNDPSIGLIVDALFGFSFKPPVRPDFLPLMNILSTAASKSIPVVSVDIPSGWNVETGPPADDSTFMPETLVSLTAPKLCASFFKGQHHFLGGRFVPQKLAEKYSLNLPAFPGTDSILKL